MARTSAKISVIIAAVLMVLVATIVAVEGFTNRRHTLWGSRTIHRSSQSSSSQLSMAIERTYIMVCSMCDYTLSLAVFAFFQFQFATSFSPFVPRKHNIYIK